jgi:hypothetical protein
VSSLWPDRILSIEVPGTEDVKPEISFVQDGKKYELLSCKVEKEKSSRGTFGNSTPTVVYYYVMVEGNDKPVLNLKYELEKLCDFGSLGRQKVIARLSHLVSEASFVQRIRWSDIERIPNSGEEGCGFIPKGEFSS